MRTVNEAAVYMHLGWCRVARELGGECAADARAGLSLLQYQLVESAMARSDWRRAVQAVRDFRAENVRPTVTIEKFSPGEHFYIGREKFASREEAEKYAVRNGYRVHREIRVRSMNDLILAAVVARKKV